jgi:hypothetical protein
MNGNIISLAERFTIKRNQIKVVGHEAALNKALNKMKEAEKLFQEAKIEYRYEQHNSRKKYQEEVAKVNEEFKLALFREYGIENHPKREKMFSVAWEKGHSDGYSSIECEFSTLVELMRD